MKSLKILTGRRLFNCTIGVDNIILILCKVKLSLIRTLIERESQGKIVRGETFSNKLGIQERGIQIKNIHH